MSQLYETIRKNGFIVKQIQMVNTSEIELTAIVNYDELTQKLEIVITKLNKSGDV